MLLVIDHVTDGRSDVADWNVENDTAEPITNHSFLISDMDSAAVSHHPYYQ